jgi:hypothetical protein
MEQEIIRKVLTPASLIDILNPTAQHLLQDAYNSLCLKKDRNLIQKWDHGDYEILFPPPKGQIPDELIQNMINSTHPDGDNCLDFESCGQALPKLKPHEQRKAIVLNQDIQRLYGYTITESLVDLYLSWRHWMTKVGHEKVHMVPCGPHLRQLYDWYVGDKSDSKDDNVLSNVWRLSHPASYHRHLDALDAPLSPSKWKKKKTAAAKKKLDPWE